jgi:uncharacterized protein YraI
MPRNAAISNLAAHSCAVQSYMPIWNRATCGALLMQVRTMEIAMRMRSLLIAAVLLGGLGFPGLAAAQTIAYAAPGTTNLRTGPGTQFPVIARVVGGSRVHVLGCLGDRSWCDVLVQDIRGWMYAGRLQFVYAGRRVYVPEYYAYFDAPVVRFDFGYWDDRRSHRRHHRRDWGGRDWGGNVETECLAPEGFCPGDRPRQRNWDGSDEWRGEPGREVGASGGASGSSELVIAPGAEVRGVTPDGSVGTECLAPDGFCP